MRLPVIALTALFVSFLASTEASAHYWIADDGCAPGTSSDGLFYASGDEWFTYYSGYNDCGMATLNSQSVRDEYAEWYLPAQSVGTPSNYNHLYNIYMTADYPYCSSQAFPQAHYHQWRLGHSESSPTSHVWWSQEDHCYGNWYYITQKYLCSTDGGFWDTWDNTYQTPGSFMLLVDAILFNAATTTHSC